MNNKAKISEERRLNAYHDRIDAIRKGGEKVKTVENETTGKVVDVLEKSEETKTLQEIPGFTGNLEALEKSGLEPFDHGEPLCPEIIVNKELEVSETEPQAWEKEGKWYYNKPGYLAEAKYLGKNLPDWGIIYEPYREDGEEMVKKLGLSFEAGRRWNTGYFAYQIVYAGYSNAFNLDFYSNNMYPAGAPLRENIFSLRFLKN